MPRVVPRVNRCLILCIPQPSYPPAYLATVWCLSCRTCVFIGAIDWCHDLGLRAVDNVEMWNFKHFFVFFFLRYPSTYFAAVAKIVFVCLCYFAMSLSFFRRKTITGIENWTETVLFLKSNYLEHIENFLFIFFFFFFPLYMQSFKIISVTPVGIRLWCWTVSGPLQWNKGRTGRRGWAWRFLSAIYTYSDLLQAI